MRGLGLMLIGASFAACTEGKPMITTVALPAIEHDALFVANGADHNLSVIDATTNQNVGEIEIRGAWYPHHLHLSPDRTRLTIALPGIDLSEGHAPYGHSDRLAALALLDVTDGTVVAWRILRAPTHNAVFSPDGREIWTALSAKPGEVLVMDPSSLDTRRTISVGESPSEVSFSPDGAFVFVANTESDDVSVIDPSTYRVIDQISVGDAPIGARPGGDGLMYVDNEASKSLTAVDASTHQVIRTYQLGFTPGVAAVAPNGELWVTDEDAGRLVFFPAGSDRPSGELRTGAGAHAIAFSDDGTRAYVANQRGGSVSVVDVAEKSLITQVIVGRKPNGVVFRAI